MAQKTIYAVTGIANWDDADKWADNADGSGATYTNPQNGSDTYICNLNGKPVTLNVDVVVDNVVESGAGYLASSTTRSITLAQTNGINYSGTSSSGMIRPSANTLAVTGAGSGTVAVLVSASGHGVLSSGTASLAVTNSGGTAAKSTGAGQAIRHAASGSLTVTGDSVVNGSGTGAGVVVASGSSFTIVGNGSVTSSGVNAIGAVWIGNAVTGTITGDMDASGTGGTIYGALYCTYGTTTFNGALTCSNAGISLNISGAAATVKWTGNRTLAAGANAIIVLKTGTLNLATADAKLTLANSGTFAIHKQGGTLNTADAGAGAASIVNQTATSYAAIVGGTDQHKAIITGPTLPAANKVKLGETQYGYVGGLLTPDYYPPNLDSNPGVEDAAAVLTTAHYGEANAIQGTGEGDPNRIAIAIWEWANRSLTE